MNTQKEFPTNKNEKKQTYRRWESPGLVYHLKPTKREAYIDGQLDEHLK